MTSPPERRSQSKYYQFHKGNGHDTEQYIELRKEIEQAIYQKYLKELVDKCADKWQDL